MTEHFEHNSLILLINTLKGELEEIIGTVVCQSPMDLWDHNKVKLSLTKKK